MKSSLDLPHVIHDHHHSSPFLLTFCSSLAGLVAFPGGGAYCSSKHALVALTDTLRRELRDVGVSVTSINPGSVKTPILNKMKDLAHAMQFHSDDWAQVYGKHYLQLEEKVEVIGMQMGDTTQVTDDAIVHALFDANPHANYYVANAGGVPAVLVMLAARLLPKYLMDLIMAAAV